MTHKEGVQMLGPSLGISHGDVLYLLSMYSSRNSPAVSGGLLDIMSVKCIGEG